MLTLPVVILYLTGNTCSYMSCSTVEMQDQMSWSYAPQSYHFNRILVLAKIVSDCLVSAKIATIPTAPIIYSATAFPLLCKPKMSQPRCKTRCPAHIRHNFSTSIMYNPSISWLAPYLVSLSSLMTHQLVFVSQAQGNNPDDIRVTHRSCASIRAMPSCRPTGESLRLPVWCCFCHK